VRILSDSPSPIPRPRLIFAIPRPRLIFEGSCDVSGTGRRISVGTPDCCNKSTARKLGMPEINLGGGLAARGAAFRSEHRTVATVRAIIHGNSEKALSVGHAVQSNFRTVSPFSGAWETKAT
jgi:hypothetical protein